MALTSAGKAWMGVAVLVASLSVFWPNLEAYLPSNASLPVSHAQTGTACPLGYGSSNTAASQSPETQLPINQSTEGPLLLGSVHLPGLGISGSSGTIVFINANIWTADEENPWADSMSVDAKGNIISVGKNLSIATGDAVVDVGGAFMMPGFVDTHVHLVPAGLLLGWANLRTASSKEAFMAGVQAAHDQLPAGQWLMGGLFDDNYWGGGLPDKTWIDQVTGDRPAFLTRMDGHLGVANSAAMQLAGLNSSTVAPEGGVVDKDEHGQLTGVFRELAMGLITSHIPEPSAAERRQAVMRAAEYALARGVTTMVDMGRAPFTDVGATWRDIEQVYEPMADSETGLPLRVSAMVPLPTWPRLAARVAALGRTHSSGRLSWGSVKEFHDGSLGSGTALMHEPYVNDPSTNGTRVIDPARLAQEAHAAAAAGLQVAIHAIGDKAVDEVLDIMAGIEHSLPASAGGGPLRHRIEHAQHLSGAAAAARFGELGVTALLNPLHLITDRHMLHRSLGAYRSGHGRAFAYKTLLEAGAPMALASDWPVVDLDPMGSFYAAAYRRLPGDKQPWTASEAIPAETSLLGHTAHAAKAALLDEWVGRLRPGLKADFVLLSGSLLDLKGEVGEQLPAVLRTYMDGACVHGCAAVDAAA